MDEVVTIFGPKHERH